MGTGQARVNKEARHNREDGGTVGPENRTHGPADQPEDQVEPEPVHPPIGVGSS